MFVVTVTIPGTFPFTEIEAHPTAALANERAAEWTELGGATHVKVDHVVDWATNTVTTMGLLAGLGAALGLEVAAFGTTETEEAVAA